MGWLSRCQNLLTKDFFKLVFLLKLRFVIFLVLSHFEKSFVTIWVFDFCQNLSLVTFWVIGCCHNLSIVRIWVLKFCYIMSFWVLSQFWFLSFYHSLSFQVSSQLEFLSFIIMSFGVSSQFEFLRFITIWVLEFHQNLSFEFYHN